MSEFTFEGGYRDGPSNFMQQRAAGPAFTLGPADGLGTYNKPDGLSTHSKPQGVGDNKDKKGAEGSEEAKALPEPQAEVTVGATVWVELSNDGPYKVIARYKHPLGAAVRASHLNSDPRTFESVMVTEDLWLCQDRTGKVHIIPGASLTTVPPESRVTKLGERVVGTATWIWSKREIALWSALAGLAAHVLVS